MEDIRKKDYAHYLEETITDLVRAPVEGICIVAKLKGGGTYASFYHSSMADKLLYAGIIQQDATIEALRANDFNERMSEGGML